MDVAEAVVACDMPEPCKFPSLDSCQKRFLWTKKEVDLAPHPVVGLALQVADTEKFPHALGFEGLDPFFFFVRVSKLSRVDVLQLQRRMEVTRDLWSLNLLEKRMVLHHQILFPLTMADGDLC